MRVIDVNQPDRSALLWRLYMAPKTFTCTDGDDYEMRRMPLIVGRQDLGGMPDSVAGRLSTAELDCARWYVHEVAKAAKAAMP
jgi:hypothetical protein